MDDKPIRRRKLKSVEQSLRSWYGARNAETALLPWLPKPTALSEILKPMQDQFLQAQNSDVSLIVKLWSECVGPRLAKYSRPVGLHQRTLIVEVDRALFIQELVRSRTQILARVHEYMGPQFCTGFWFKPLGGTPSEIPPSRT